mmetsp:Transcript_112395/g.317971  ORF Transcript_112395/g.317971 Transcript_112395/m.317971 type:complete len:377 (-) Transcript_112395:246-1376(-)
MLPPWLALGLLLSRTGLTASLKDWSPLLQVDKGNALEFRGPPQVTAKSARFTARSTHSSDVTQDQGNTYEEVGQGQCSTNGPSTAGCPASMLVMASSESECASACDGQVDCTGYSFGSEGHQCRVFFAIITTTTAGGDYVVFCFRRPNWRPTCQESVVWPPPATTTTAATTTTTTTATTTARPASSYGDPHVTTLRGEHFDIQQPGTHTYLVVPRGASLGTAMLWVQAKVRAIGPLCGDGIFLTGLMMGGGWLQGVGTLEFATTTREFDSDETIGIKVNGSRVDWQTLAVKMPPGVAQASRFHPVQRQHPTAHVDTLRVNLQLGPANLTVGWSHIFKPMVNWLWMEVAGLDEAGGLLGMDDHTWAATRPGQCDTQG